MGTRRQFSREFKLEAVKLVKERGVTVAQAVRDLDVHETVLRKWMREQASDQRALRFTGSSEARRQLQQERLAEERQRSYRVATSGSRSRFANGSGKGTTSIKAMILDYAVTPLLHDSFMDRMGQFDDARKQPPWRASPQSVWIGSPCPVTC